METRGADLLKQMVVDLYAGMATEVAAAAQRALDLGMTPATILNEGLIAGMDVVGRDFRQGVLFVPEVLFAAKAMKVAMDILKPLLAQTGARRIGSLAIGTVQGDVHDIGKNLVVMMMEGAGFAVTDLGTNTAPERFVETVRDLRPDMLGMSALLTTTMPMIRVTIDALQAAGLRAQVRILIGGAPITETWAQEAGADAYARDAVVAVEKAKKLIGRGQEATASERPTARSGPPGSEQSAGGRVADRATGLPER